MSRGEGSGEDRLIARHFRPLAKHPGALGLADDAAVLTPPPGCDLVLTTDGIIAGVHVFPDAPADAIARRALRVNLSDLAAKGAKPVGFLLAVALPGGTTDAWLAEFVRGLSEDAERYGCPLLGGDTDHTPGPLSVSITAFGMLPAGTMVRRNGAQPGDVLFVTGTVGDAALGLMLRKDAQAGASLTPAQRNHLLMRYLQPDPRNVLAETVRTHASAALDISDGLAGDLTKLCRASGVTAEIEAAQVPLSDATRALITREPALLERALTGGDDYEILAAVPAGKAQAFRASAHAAGIAVTDIGLLAAGEAPPQFIGPDRQPIAFARTSYSHF
ncbi:MAG: thiamine-phosphate kinase [Bradyrhizobiaceae bacterium]|nr:thiamine-phosphate kinase [Hyphomicrobiales bacterium]MBV9428057.1 thiamine-phosphate kinase [Bradyrhizobiaceae bacterium]